MSPKTTPSSTQPLKPCYMSEEELKEQFSRDKIATAGARALEMLADPAYDHFSFYDFLCEMMLAQDTNRKANAPAKRSQAHTLLTPTYPSSTSALTLKQGYQPSVQPG
ncbi:hypothetical protein [Corynebacterium cystitidis]|uniref:hypothetical protein n=1 Tax=Corynebacterium cystitidis TaxID=35757 RepID=UPI00211F2840|nr:hypothetical protein [Corynebacterium cystitidis]